MRGPAAATLGMGCCQRRWLVPPMTTRSPCWGSRATPAPPPAGGGGARGGVVEPVVPEAAEVVIDVGRAGLLEERRLPLEPRRFGHDLPSVPMTVGVRTSARRLACPMSDLDPIPRPRTA